MSTIDYQAIANDPGANVVNQAAFLAALGVGGSIENGFQAGTALSNLVNKVLRQSSVMTAALAQMISDALGVDMLDDGDVAALTVKLKAALLTSAWSSGDGKLTFKSVADAGWVLINDGSIGNAGSGATTRANADTLALYTVLWTNIIDTWAPVSGGRGGSAVDDFNAGKTLTIPKQLGRAIAVAGAGGGLTARVLGQKLGNETHTLTTAELPVGTFVHDGGGNIWPYDTTPQSFNNNGGGAAHDIMNPVSYWNVMLKL